MNLASGLVEYRPGSMSLANVDKDASVEHRILALLMQCPGKKLYTLRVISICNGRELFLDFRKEDVLVKQTICPSWLATFMC